MSNMMIGFPKEKIRIFKKDGSIIENVDALFSKNTVLVEDTTIRIESGDCLARILPNGLEENFLVLDNGYFGGSGGSIPPHYQIKTKKIEKPQNVNNEDGTMKKPKLFISHASKDVMYVEQLVELLADIGLNDETMFCSSVPGYHIPLDNDIYEYLKTLFSEYDLHIIFIL